MRARIRSSIIMLMAIMIMPGVLGLNTLVASGAVLDVTLLNYEPVPAEPGDVVDVYLLISNNGGESAKDVKIYLRDNYPFTSDNADASMKEYQSIPGQESQLVKFKVRVDKDAPEGTNYLKVEFGSKNSQGTKEKYLELDINTNDAAIGIDRIITTPEVIPPGGKGRIEIYLKNLADSRLRDIAMSLSTEKTIGSTTQSVPFAPIGGSLEKRFNELFADQEMRVVYDIIVNPSAESDVYEIPITITFSDERSNDYTMSDEVALIVNAVPDLEVYLDETDLYSDQLRGDFTLKFVNKGLATIKSVTAEVQETEEFEMLASTNKVYIGNIESDDYETNTFNIEAKESAFTIPVKVTYLDSLNNEYTQDVQLEVDLLSLNQVGMTNGSNSSTIVIVIIVVLVIAIILYRVMKKRRKKRK